MNLKTKDGYTIAGKWRYVEHPKGYLLLLHMMPAAKESWDDFAEFMLQHGYASLAIDLRGHGESTGGPSGYKHFIETEHQKSELDVEEAVKFLRKKGAKSEDMVMIGASIGANLSLQYLGNHGEVPYGVLLSPGLNYRGISGEEAVRKLSQGQKIIFASSRDDERVQGNAEMVEALYDATSTEIEKKLLIYNFAGHGTDMFKTIEEPNLKKVILDFLEGR